MFQDKPAWVERERARWLRPDAERWIRHDAHRFMPPGAPRFLGKEAVRYFWPDAADDQRAEASERKHDIDLSAARGALLQLRCELARLEFGLKFRRLLREKAYNPNQPRVPAGNADGGQWTAEGGVAGPKRIRLAGSLPTNDPPEIPQRRPLTAQERNAFLKSAARWLARVRALGARISPFATALEAMSWIDTDRPFIESYQDPPKTLEELQQGALEGRKNGYNIHHIVEQASAENDGFSRDQIDGSENLVRVPTLKHWEITGWYVRPNRDFDGLLAQGVAARQGLECAVGSRLRRTQEIRSTQAMNRVDLSRMTVDQLVERFAVTALEQDQAELMDDNAKFTRLYWQLDEIEKELKGRGGDQRRSLVRLYHHFNAQVRLAAAKATLAVVPVEARQTLEAIANSHQFPQAGDAGMTLTNLDRGFFNPT